MESLGKRGEKTEKSSTKYYYILNANSVCICVDIHQGVGYYHDTWAPHSNNRLVVLVRREPPFNRSLAFLQVPKRTIIKKALEEKSTR